MDNEEFPVKHFIRAPSVEFNAVGLKRSPKVLFEYDNHIQQSRRDIMFIDRRLYKDRPAP